MATVSSEPIVITAAVQKGGVGKTLLSTHLAAFLVSAMKAKVLVVDMDMSGVASRRLLLHGSVIPDDVTSNVECLEQENWLPATSRLGIDVIPSFSGHDIHQQLHDLFSQDKYKLRHNIKKQPYDYIIIDGYPRLDARLEGCLLASDYVVGVGEPSTDDVQGFVDVWKRLKELSEAGYETPSHLGYVFNKVRGKSPVAFRELKKLVKSLGYLAFSNSVTQRDPIANACNESRLIWELAPGQARVASIELEDVCEEILEKIGDNEDNNTYKHYTADLGGAA